MAFSTEVFFYCRPRAAAILSPSLSAKPPFQSLFFKWSFYLRAKDLQFLALILSGLFFFPSLPRRRTYLFTFPSA